MAIKSDGKLYAWGGNAAGQLGTNDTSTRSSAVQVGSASWTLVSAGNSYTVAVNAAGKLFAWGLNATGQLGDASETNRLSPVQIGTADWTKIDAGSDVTAGIS
jgi:alpha-tubulin suppressor-like RCC1 family protein